MSELEPLIADLALILICAGAMTLLFKRLKQPVVLGYIVAGFLISPYFPLFFDVTNQASIETWSEIGVVIILFHIGLEFDLHKIADIGGTAVVSAAVKMGGMMLVGYAFGRMIGLSQFNCIYRMNKTCLSYNVLNLILL